MHTWRKILAILAASLAAAALPTLIVCAFVYAIGRDQITRAEWWIVFVTLFAFALAHVVLLGLPAAALLRRLRRVDALPVAVAGLLVGALPYGLYALGDDLFGAGGDAWLDWLQETALFAVLGLVGAPMFMAVYRAIVRPVAPVAPAR